RHVDGERRVTALVTRHLFPVHPHDGAVVDGAETAHPPARPERVEAPAIQTDIRLFPVADARQSRLRGERNHDAAVESLRRPDAEIPLAVEIDPTQTAQRWSGIFGPR